MVKIRLTQPKISTIDSDKQAVKLICNSYRNHPSVLKIKSNIATKGNINDNNISACE